VLIEDPEALKKSQRELCEWLGLKGRIIVASEGINGTVEGDESSTNEYMKVLSSDSRFADINFKIDEGTGEAFPKLSVKVRKEIVSAHLGDEDVKPWETTGKYLSAEELHKWVKEGKEFTIVDMRNNYEYKIGHFEGSVNMKLDNFRDLPKALSKIESLKDKTVVPICTGGVRCEKASGYLIKKGFKDVYQLHNGIVDYMKKYPNEAFKGKLYVFDKRIAVDFDEPGKHTVVGKCDVCSEPTERYVNCRNKECNAHFLICDICKAEKDVFCGEECRNTIMTKV